MGKKNKNWYLEDDSDDVVLVIDKKTKRRLERQKAKEEQQRQQAVQTETSGIEAVSEQAEESEASDDGMTKIPGLCQERNWREAVLVCRRAIEDCKAEGRDEMVEYLSCALVKLEKSLRRQMVAAFIVGARDLLKKEYLLDVGEE